MTARRVRLVLAVMLFTAWVGWLAYHAYTVGNPIVVSFPQVMRATFVVDAEVRGDGTAVVKQVRRGPDRLKPGAEFRIPAISQASNWSGPGTYILALYPSPAGGYELVQTPPMTGQSAVYPLNPSTDEQVRKALANSLPADEL